MCTFSVDEKKPNKLIEVWLLKQGHCTEYVTGVTVAVELKSRSYKYSWNPGLSKVYFAGKEAKEGKESGYGSEDYLWNGNFIIFTGNAGTERSGIKFCLGQKRRLFQNIQWILMYICATGSHSKQEVAPAAVGPLCSSIPLDLILFYVMAVLCRIKWCCWGRQLFQAVSEG